MVIPWSHPAEGHHRDLPADLAGQVHRVLTAMNPRRCRADDRMLPWPYWKGCDGRGDEPACDSRGRPLRETLPNQTARRSASSSLEYGSGRQSIAKIRFVDYQPKNTWQVMTPNEYGFYANVNPSVDHPRWTQASERRIGEFFRRKTLPFNGYADQVASMYAGMDLKKNY